MVAALLSYQPTELTTRTSKAKYVWFIIDGD